MQTHFTMNRILIAFTSHMAAITRNPNRIPEADRYVVQGTGDDALLYSPPPHRAAQIGISNASLLPPFRTIRNSFPTPSFPAAGPAGCFPQTSHEGTLAHTLHSIPYQTYFRTLSGSHLPTNLTKFVANKVWRPRSPWRCAATTNHLIGSH